MRWRCTRLAVVVALVMCGTLANAAERALWTTSKVVGSAEPPDPYRLELAYPKLKLFEPLSAGLIPGSKRLLVAERPGKIWVLDASSKEPQPQLVVDLKRTVYGIVAHPQFEKNGFLFVTSVADPANPSPNGSRLTRLTVARGESLTADVASEKLILEWPSGGHNGGCVRFGLDGMLYLVTGDGSGIADELQTGQDLSDLLGASCASTSTIRPAIEPTAFRRTIPSSATRKLAAKFGRLGIGRFGSFRSTRPTGQMWGGEVGQDLWEMVYLIQKGGNYGWSVREGAHPFRPERPKGPAEFVAPIVEHPHSDFRSITGGWVYRGKRLPELVGPTSTATTTPAKSGCCGTTPSPRKSRNIVNSATRRSASSRSSKTRPARFCSWTSPEVGCID